MREGRLEQDLRICAGPQKLNSSDPARLSAQSPSERKVLAAGSKELPVGIKFDRKRRAIDRRVRLETRSRQSLVHSRRDFDNSRRKRFK